MNHSLTFPPTFCKFPDNFPIPYFPGFPYSHPVKCKNLSPQPGLRGYNLDLLEVFSEASLANHLAIVLTKTYTTTINRYAESLHSVLEDNA